MQVLRGAARAGATGCKDGVLQGAIVTRHQGVSAKKRWALFAVSAVATGFLFWSPTAKEHTGYLLPLVMSVCLAMSNGFLFIASRLDRSDVTNLERRIRHMMFRKI